jgi:histidinol-phosphate aminotransferase
MLQSVRDIHSPKPNLRRLAPASDRANGPWRAYIPVIRNHFEFFFKIRCFFFAIAVRCMYSLQFFRSPRPLHPKSIEFTPPSTVPPMPHNFFKEMSMYNDVKSGLSRRSFMRTLGAASVAASSLPAFAALQQAPAGAAQAAGGRRGGMGMAAMTAPDPDVVKISGNENPLGPSDLARWAIASTGPLGGRYGGGVGIGNQPAQILSEQFALVAKPVAVDPAAPAGRGGRGGGNSYVNLYAGSGGALDLALYSSLLNGKDLIVGEPSYEQGASAGATMKVQVHRVPLTPTGAHDVKAMLAASNNIGAFYICNPNNPTGTMTPKADIGWLIDNKPAGSTVIVDEAYHHFSPDESSITFVGQDKDVIVLRTFSKIYGMAGLRAGFMIAKPELHARIQQIGTGAGTGVSVSITTIAACTASMNDATLIPTRRKINKDIRENVLEWMDKNGYKYYPGSQANFFQADVKRPGREFSANMLKEKVQIGRTWAAQPNYCRITVGTQAEMDKFKVAYKKCYEMSPAPASAHLDMPFVENPSELNRHLYV